MSPEVVVLASIGPALLGGVLALCIDAFGSRRVAVSVVGLGLVASGGVSVWAIANAPVASAWSVVHVHGPFSTIAALICVLAAFSVLGGWPEFTQRENGGSLAGLIAIAAVASVLVASARDITLLLISLETAAACGYALVASSRTRRGDEAAMKYFVQGAIATGFFVFGMAVLVTVFAPRGDLDLLRGAFTEPRLFPVAVVGVVLIIAVLAFKAGVAPFHSWAPDAYESAPPAVASFLSAGPKLAAITALALLAQRVSALQLTTPVLPEGQFTVAIAVVICVLAVISVVVGSLVALRQRSYTRMLAYAGIAQAGYALIGAATLGGAVAAVFFASTYAIAATGTFMCATAFRRERPGWDGSIEGLAGMGRKAPLLSGAVSVLLISLAGIPPLLGFWGKFVAFGAAIAQASSYFRDVPILGWASAIAATAGIAGSVISLGYYGGVLRALYLLPAADSAQDETAAADQSPSKDPKTALWVVVGLAVVVIALGLVPLVAGVAPLLAGF